MMALPQWGTRESVIMGGSSGDVSPDIIPPLKDHDTAGHGGRTWGGA